MRIRDLIERSLELSRSIPYRHISDSPTIKSYTNWLEYDKYSIVSELEEDLLEIFSEDMPKKIGPMLNSYDIVYYGSKLFKRDINGVEIGFLERRDLLKDYSNDKLFRLVDPEESRIYARHIGGISSVLILRLHKTLAKPLKIFIGGGLPKTQISQHVLTLIEEGVEASIIIATEPLSNSMRTFVGEYYIDRSAGLRIGLINMGGVADFHSNHYLLSQDSSLEIYTLSMGGAASRFQNRVGLEGDYSRHASYSLTISSGSEWIHFIDSSLLRGSNTISYVTSRALALGKSKNIVQGYITQRETAKKSRANVDVSALNVGGEALTVTTPFLLVETGEVEEAVHSSSQAIMDQDTMVYLRSRGFNERDIIELVVSDYVGDYIEKVPEYMREIFIEYIERYFRDRGIRIISLEELRGEVEF
ncbi:MAG: SufD family Fe-S cluster assembly protein [Sulfolobales archaeon]